MLRMSVPDLGVAAYVKMNGFKCIGRKGRNFYFDVAPGSVDEFNRLQVEYLSGPFHQFDAELMSLKKLPEYLREDVR